VDYHVERNIAGIEMKLKQQLFDRKILCCAFYKTVQYSGYICILAVHSASCTNLPLRLMLEVTVFRFRLVPPRANAAAQGVFRRFQ
jgi:hypothetical protein